MFEIGFSEIVLIAIVALLVVGPQEFPALVRNIGSWLGKARRFMSSVKSEFDREINKAEEIKRG
jgi:sec-independent protein translocase protein TatB